MNKALIKKYKAEFEYWLNDGEVLHKRLNSSGWYTKDCWSDQVSIIQTIIINDKYVKFRKALIEGKTIQIYDIIKQHPDNPEFDVYDWKDFKSFKPYSQFTYEPNKYRVKPEEPKFKKELTC